MDEELRNAIPMNQFFPATVLKLCPAVNPAGKRIYYCSKRIVFFMPAITELILYFNAKAARIHPARVTEFQQLFREAGFFCTSLFELHELPGLQGRHIVIFGGDGSIHQVLNHSDISSNSYSFVRSGSGNDLLKNFGRPDVMALSRKIKTAQYAQMDLIDFNGKLCVNAGGFAFDAAVASGASQLPRRLKQFRYPISVAMNMFRFKPMQVSIETEKLEYSGPAFMVCAGNGAFAGGGFRIYPRALVNDGKFDLLLIRPIHFFQKIKYALLAKNGGHLGFPQVSYSQCTEARIRFEREVQVDIDGDVYAGKEFILKILPAALRIIQ